LYKLIDGGLPSIFELLGCRCDIRLSIFFHRFYLQGVLLASRLVGAANFISRGSRHGEAVGDVGVDRIFSFVGGVNVVVT